MAAAAGSRPSEPPYSTLNNLDTIRSYGSAADDLDTAPLPPHSACQYLQVSTVHLYRPTVPASTCM